MSAVESPRRGSRPIRRSYRLRPNSGLLIFGAVFVLVFVLFPIGTLVQRTLLTEEGRAAFATVFTDQAALDSILGTVIITTGSLVIGVPLAVLFAWICVNTNVPGGRFLGILPIASLVISPLISALGWLMVLTPRVGLANQAFNALFAQPPSEPGPFNANSLLVIIFVTSMHVVPFVYAPVAAALRQIDASMVEAAQTAGVGGFRIFRTIVLPVIWPSILAGALIGGVVSASEFSIVLLLGSGTGITVVPVQIYVFVTRLGLQAEALALSSLLSVVTILATIMYARMLSSRSYATLSGKGHREWKVKLGWSRFPLAIVLPLFFLQAIIPLAALAYLSLVPYWGLNAFSQPISFQQYADVMAISFARTGLVNSLWLSAVSATLALAVGSAIAYARLRSPGVASKTLSVISTIPLGLPGIVFGLGVLIAFQGWPLPLYGTVLVLLAGYLGDRIPYSVRNGEGTFGYHSVQLEEAARVVGDRQSGILLRIVLPLIRVSLISTWMLMFIMCFRDISISVLVYPAGQPVASVSLLNIYGDGAATQAAAYSIIMTLVPLAVVLLVGLLTNGVPFASRRGRGGTQPVIGGVAAVPAAAVAV